VAIQSRYRPTLIIRQSFIAFEAIIDMPETRAQSVGIQQRMNPSHSIGAAGFFYPPGFPPASLVELFPSIEAS
jgi:hypothetical protein